MISPPVEEDGKKVMGSRERAELLLSLREREKNSPTYKTSTMRKRTGMQVKIGKELIRENYLPWTCLWLHPEWSRYLRDLPRASWSAAFLADPWVGSSQVFSFQFAGEPKNTSACLTRSDQCMGNAGGPCSYLDGGSGGGGCLANLSFVKTGSPSLLVFEERVSAQGLRTEDMQLKLFGSEETHWVLCLKETQKAALLGARCCSGKWGTQALGAGSRWRPRTREGTGAFWSRGFTVV